MPFVGETKGSEGGVLPRAVGASQLVSLHDGEEHKDPATDCLFAHPAPGWFKEEESSLGPVAVSVSSFVGFSESESKSFTVEALMSGGSWIRSGYRGIRRRLEPEVDLD